MIPSYVRGPIAPVFTACQSDGRLDDDGQRAFLDFLVDGKGVSAYFMRCGMGRMYSFNYEEVKQIARVSCKHMVGKGPVLVGTTGIWDRNMERRPDPKVFTTQAVELSQYAEEQGAAAIVQTLPEAIVPESGQTCADVILAYFDKITRAVKVPVFIYQSPGTDAAYRLTPELVAQLGDIPNLVAAKISSTDAAHFLDLTWGNRGKDFSLIMGNETAFYVGLTLGWKAVIGQGCTLNPGLMVVLQDRFERGDFDGALDAQRAVNKLVQYPFSATEFGLRYAAEKGYRVQPYERTSGSPYAQPDQSQSDKYNAFKRLFESILDEFGVYRRP